MNGGGGVFLRRYWAGGRLTDLDQALSLWQVAVQRTPPDSPDLPSLLTNLGNGLSDRYARTGRLADLEEAIRRLPNRRCSARPPTRRTCPPASTTWATASATRYAYTGQLANLEEAIRVCHAGGGAHPARLAGPALTPHQPGYRPPHPLHPHGPTRGPGRSHRGVSASGERTPPDSPNLPTQLNNLGIGLRTRYTRTGQLADLEEAIQVYQQAVDRTPPDSPDLPVYLNNLGNGLSDRYARTGPAGGPGRSDPGASSRRWAERRLTHRTCPPRLTNLGAGLSARYSRTPANWPTWTKPSGSVSKQSEPRTPPDSPGLPSCPQQPGQRPSATTTPTPDQLTDLEEAIRVYQTSGGPHVARLAGPALLHPQPGHRPPRQGCPHGATGQPGRSHPSLSGRRWAARRPTRRPCLFYLNNLGAGLSAHYTAPTRSMTWKKRFRSTWQAVGHTPPDSPDLPALQEQPGQRPPARATPAPASGQPGRSDPGPSGWPWGARRPTRPTCPATSTTWVSVFSDRYARSGQLADLEEPRQFMAALVEWSAGAPEVTFVQFT